MSENEIMTTSVDEVADLQARVQELETKLGAVEGNLPKTWLLSESLAKRALAVYGHYLLVGLIIAIPIMLCSFGTMFFFAMMAALAGGDFYY
ncbi:MAG: hypothetical protein J5I90_07305 [Caldilineales bacterium]|nr:hypothetical protein [Caldilineales bacterium]